MKTVLAVAALALAAVSPASASILPTGVQTNVATSTVTGTWGFTQCWSGNYASGGTSIASILSGCQGDYLMMAAKQVGSNTYSVLGAANRADVIFGTGGSSNKTETHEANGIEWYFNSNWSWGFAPQDANVFTSSCDVGAQYPNGNYTGSDGSEAQRLCWHAGSGAIQEGWSGGAGATGYDSNAYNGQWERFLLVGTAAEEVPEPAMLGLFGLGVIGLAGARRRKG